MLLYFVVGSTILTTADLQASVTYSTLILSFSLTNHEVEHLTDLHPVSMSPISSNYLPTNMPSTLVQPLKVDCHMTIYCLSYVNDHRKVTARIGLTQLGKVFTSCEGSFTAQQRYKAIWSHMRRFFFQQSTPSPPNAMHFYLYSNYTT